MNYTKPMIVPSRVAKLMKDAELGPVEVGKELGVNYQLVQNLLRGQYKKNPQWADGLTTVLKASWEYLTGQSDNPAGAVNGSLGKTTQNVRNRTKGARETEEGPHMFQDIIRQLGVMEGSLKTHFNARFDRVEDKLDNHEKRLEALESGSGPQKGRGRR